MNEPEKWWNKFPGDPGTEYWPVWEEDLSLFYSGAPKMNVSGAEGSDEG